MSMPSDGFTFDELREEYDWMSDFMGRMAERIRGNPDVSSLAAYVAKLEAENAKLRELCADMWGTMDLLDACGVDEYDEPLNCCTGCNQYGSVDEFAGGKRVIGCKLMYRMSELGVD